MGKKTFVLLPVNGPLDTANPSTNREPGTLVKAIDAAHRWIGPRRGGKIMSWTGRLPSSIAVRPGMTPDFSLDGSNSYVKGILAREQIDLSNRWTCDVAFHAFANRTVNAAVPVFRWLLDSSIVAIEIGHYGSTHAQAGKVYAIVKTTSSAGVLANTYTLIGGSVNFAGSTTYVSGGKIVRTFARLIRDGSTLTLLDSTTATSNDTTLNAEESHAGSTGSDGSWFYGKDSDLAANHTFNGYALRALIRDSAAPTTLYPPTMEHIFPRAPNVRFFAGAQLYNSGIGEFSRFGSHGVATGTGTGSVTDTHYPYAKVIQGMGSFTDKSGLGMSCVMAGGTLLYQRTR